MNKKKVCNYDFFDITNTDNRKDACETFYESIKNPFHVPVVVKSLKAFKFVCESNFKIIKFETFLKKNGDIKEFNNKMAKKIGSAICRNLDELYLFISKQKSNSFKIMTNNISDNVIINKITIVNTTLGHITKNQMKGLAFLVTKINAEYFAFWAPEISNDVLSIFYKTLYKLNNSCLCEIKIKNTYNHRKEKIMDIDKSQRLLFSEIQN